VAQARELADKALAAFIIIHAALKRSQRLFDYSLREDLNKRMPNFQVSPHPGLHVPSPPVVLGMALCLVSQHTDTH
jgi:hypothetical protein